jgi:hypothetical protein
VTEAAKLGPTDLLPNLGAEEGNDWHAYHRQPAVRTAAHLWCLLFGKNAQLRTPTPDAEIASDPESVTSWTTLPRSELWPESLGPAPPEPAFPWLAESMPAAAWFNTPSLARSVNSEFKTQLAGPSPECLQRVHDKAFAAEAAQTLDLLPRALAPLVKVLEPKDCQDPETLIKRLEAELVAWPEWTGRNFTLKPRFGSSGRGRVGGRDRIDTPALRGALPRFAERGGAIFEPWLDRVGDFSVSLWLPGPAAEDSRPTILGSLEMWNSPGGVYKGHCGEVDSRGRVFSGDRQDESLRADAAAVAAMAAATGFAGPCGLDALRYREGDAGSDSQVLRLRSAVEFNARPTMGLVTIGLMRRALPGVRGRLELKPGDRRGFALVYRDPLNSGGFREFQDRLGRGARVLDLSSGREPGGPRPTLVFYPDLDELRGLRDELLGS